MFMVIVEVTAVWWCCLSVYFKGTEVIRLPINKDRVQRNSIFQNEKDIERQT
jgi:hypothetical protein